MKYYNLSSATRIDDGSVLGYHFTDVPESAKDNLAAMFAKTGVKLEFEYSHTITDTPVFRHATDDERAMGAPEIVKNVGPWTGETL